MARKPSPVVEEAPAQAIIADATLAATAVDADVAAQEIAVDRSDDHEAPALTDEPPASAGGRLTRTSKRIAVAVAAVAVATAVVLVTNVVSDSSDVVGLPSTVSGPSAVLDALVAAGFDCRGAVVVDEVGTCNSSVAVRVFATSDDAQSWISGLLKDPATNSSIGWVRHGNVVVAAPLVTTPDVAAALGADSEIF